MNGRLGGVDGARCGRTEGRTVTLTFAVRLLAVFVAIAAATTRAASASPALWLVESAHAKVYLFGTIHVLRPAQQWHSPTLDAAIAQSDDLWLEVPDADDPAAAMPLIATIGLDPDHPLSTKLTPTDLARVDAAAKEMGASEASIDMFRPWLAGMTLEIAPLMRAGYDAKSGVDLQLKGAFVARGKPVRGFETIEQQMHFFADLPPREEIAFLDSTLDSLGSSAPSVDTLVTQWANGDVDKLAATENGDDLRNSTALYTTLVVSRNAAWARRLDELLRGSGVHFVAVGAAHLAGPQSVQADLEKLGYRVRRMQ
jgi:uncharacterized protein YbaP (TraB family)